jgi:hypothetical protein
MANISDSSGAKVDLKENKNATLWRRLTIDELTDLIGYSVFVKLQPRNAEEIDVTNISVVSNIIEFQFETNNLPRQCPYVVGWTDPNARVEILMFGNVVLV